MIQELQPASARLHQFFLWRFLKPALINLDLVRQMDFSCQSKQVPLNEVELGTECELHLEEALQNGIIETEIINFRENCLRFYVTVSNEIRNRLPRDNVFLRDLTTFTYANVFRSSDKNKTLFNEVAIARRLGHFDIEALEREWDSFRTYCYTQNNHS
uniref:uncharacterized protein LOC117610840 n=1 Tax=Osmia lignaria TaxID=473952 RepID=UPI0014783D4A|nr:uncharacterized protein LOC117610840 [Osmia lignaria]